MAAIAPGMRELGMSNVKEGLEDTFSDIIELAGMCKLRNCRHQSEPGCAVKKAVEDGTISAKRLKLFMDLQEENSGKK